MDGVVVRRVIPSDNSCLFNAIGYVMEHNKRKAHELRQVIAAAVSGDKTTYTEAFLGKLNEDYCTWILDPEKWGGAIELSILADYYGREIAAYDIQTTRDLYGQGKNYEERVMLIYDGLHYDALAMTPFDDAPEEFDQTIFQVRRDGFTGPVEQITLNLVKELHRKRSYTDTSNFTLRCGVCQIGVIGQKEAVEHAQATGHVNFQEYRKIKATVGWFPRPLLDLSSHNFANIMNEAFGYDLNPPFDPYDNSINFLLATYFIPYVGLTGCKPEPQRLAAELLGMEAGQHAVGRGLLYERRDELVHPYNITVAEFTDRITLLRNRLGGCAVKDEGLVVPVEHGPSSVTEGNVLAGDTNSLSYARTPAEVLRVVYGTGSEHVAGGFFPVGRNGKIARSYLDVL